MSEDHPPKPERRPTKAGPPAPLLDYRAHGSAEPGVFAWWQAVLGLLAYAAAAASGVTIGALLKWAQSAEVAVTIVAIAVIVPMWALALVTRHVRRELGWRSFLPGVLIGVGLTALVATICGGLILVYVLH